MLMKESRELVASYARRMSAEGFNAAASGNISIIDRQSNTIAITPSGLDYLEMGPEDIVVCHMDGNILEGNHKPSSEFGLHRVFYDLRPDCTSVIHTHSIYCTTFAVLRRPLVAVHYAITGAGVTEIPVVPYRTFGTPELAEATAEVLRQNATRAVLLANHGMIVAHADIAKAYDLAVNLEFLAEIQYRAECIGIPHVLTEEEMQDAFERFKTYGVNVEK